MLSIIVITQIAHAHTGYNVVCVEMSLSSSEGPLLIFHSAFCPFPCRSTSSLSQDLMLERFSWGKTKFDKPVSIPSPGEYGVTPQQWPLVGIACQCRSKSVGGKENELELD